MGNTSYRVNDNTSSYRANDNKINIEEFGKFYTCVQAWPSPPSNVKVDTSNPLKYGKWFCDYHGINRDADNKCYIGDFKSKVQTAHIGEYNYGKACVWDVEDTINYT